MRRGIVIAVILCAGPACGPARLDRQAQDYVRIAVALGERDPDSIDFYYGPPAAVADLRKNPPSLNEIRQSARALESRLKGDPTNRGAHLARQVHAVAERSGALLGAVKSFDEETEAYFGVPVPAADLSRFSETRKQIDQLLPGGGSLASRYWAFDEKFLIPPERLPAVMARAIQGCREQTLQHMPLPAGEKVDVEYVTGKPWSAFSHYRGNFRSVIEVNVDFGITVDRAVQLACHEGYPGHHVQSMFQEIRFVRDLRQREWMVQPAFSPQSLVSEAMATFAVNLAFPGPDRARFERDALFPLAALDPAEAVRYERVERLVDQLQPAIPAIARDFLDGRLEWVRAAQALEDQVLMAHPEQALKYISEFRSYVVTYTLGPELVAQRVHDWPRFRQLMTDSAAAAVLRGAALRSMMKP